MPSPWYRMRMEWPISYVTCWNRAWQPNFKACVTLRQKTLPNCCLGRTLMNASSAASQGGGGVRRKPGFQAVLQRYAFCKFASHPPNCPPTHLARTWWQYPSSPEGCIWHNMVVLWNSHTVKQYRWRFCLIQIKHYSTRGPIPLWLCVPHVHWCIDCAKSPYTALKQTRDCFTVSMHTATMQKNKFWN